MNTLYAFIPCAPYSAHERRGVGRRGLHQLIGPEIGFSEIGNRYYRLFLPAASAAGVQLLPCFHLPWGREMGFVAVEGNEGQYTDMRADAKPIADADSRWQWLSQALTTEIVAGLTEGRTPAVYFGGNPADMTLASAGLIPLHHMGVTLVGDAVSVQDGTAMLESMLRAHEGHRVGRGGRVMVEANWDTRDRHRLPCVASWHLWGEQGRYTLGDAPAGSGVLFRQGVGDGDQWGVAEAAVKAGLDLWVNLDVTADTARLFAMVGRTTK